MTVKATEVGKRIVYATFFDLSANTSLEIHITNPDGTMTTIPTGRITISATVINDATLGVIAGNTYMIFFTEATDFPIPGTYTICGKYTDATPKVYYGDDATIEVGDAC